MSRLSDYRYEMTGAVRTDREIEQLLSGGPDDGGEFDALVPFVDALRAQGVRTPSDAAIDRFAAEAAAIARSGLMTRATGSNGRFLSSLPRLRPQLAVALATIVFLAGMTGVAAAADGAAPGDALYALDRALERIGIGDSGVEERLEEAAQLVADGDPERALEHATEAFDEAAEAGQDMAAVNEARDAIADAAARVVSSAVDGNAAIVQENVATLLRYIRENLGKDVGADGREFGQSVSELARNIATSDETGETDEPEGNTGISPEDVGEEQRDPGPPTVVPDGPGGNGDGNGNGNDGGNGNGNDGGNGNGPPEGSPSDTAPGRGNHP
jgi:hypothetical protein